MSKKIFILMVGRKEEKVLAILEFPKGLRPCLGMELIKESQMPITWKIIGISPPIFKDMLENEMRMYYDSDVIWDCLLMPVDHSQSLSVGESLVFE